MANDIKKIREDVVKKGTDSLKNAKCPSCGHHGLSYKKGFAECKKCGFRLPL